MDTTKLTDITAEELITASITHTAIAHAAFTSELAASLMELSDDSAETASMIEYWGTDDDGNRWRVHLVEIPHELTLELVSLMSLSDERGGQFVWHVGRGRDEITVRIKPGR